MFDDIQRLQDDGQLANLLFHFADAGKADRYAWQNRVMAIEGVNPKELTRLHGELIAFDWIEQNSGHTATVAEPIGARCYRVTLNGLRTTAQLRGVEYVDVPAVAGKDRRTGRKKERGMPACESNENASPPEAA